MNVYVHMCVCCVRACVGDCCGRRGEGAVKEGWVEGLYSEECRKGNK